MRLEITPEAYARLYAYIDAASGEIILFGECRVERAESRRVERVLIEKLHLLPHTASPSSAGIEASTLAEFLFEFEKAGGKSENLKAFIHSHADMKAFWSQTDTETLAEFFGGWRVALVVNKDRELLARLDVYEPVHLSQELDLRIAYELPEVDTQEIEAEVALKVKTVPSYLNIVSSAGRVINLPKSREASIDLETIRKLSGCDCEKCLQGIGEVWAECEAFAEGSCGGYLEIEDRLNEDDERFAWRGI